MATRGVSMTIPFVLWDTSANAAKTGDSAQVAPRWVKDGTIETLDTATVTEVDATNAPGLYKCTVSATEADCDIGVLCGKSTTSNISMIPVTIQFERLPDAAPAAAGGLILDTQLPTNFGDMSITETTGIVSSNDPNAGQSPDYLGWLKFENATGAKIGPFRNSITGAAVDDLVFAREDIRISKNGGGFDQTSEVTPTVTHDEGGWYTWTIPSADLDVAGPFTVSIEKSGCEPVRHRAEVVAATSYASLIAGTDVLLVDVYEINGQVVTATGGAITVGAYIGSTAAASTHSAANVYTAFGTGGNLTTCATATSTTVSDKTGFELAAAEDVYHADIYVTVDETNSQDEYTVVWFKNGVRITSGITVPKIQVVKRSDGEDLIASTALTEIGTTETFKYDEATADNRLTAGQAAVAIVTAMIDEASREFSRPVGRDSSS